VSEKNSFNGRPFMHVIEQLRIRLEHADDDESQRA
jgi:hypothetical protein